MQTDLSLHWTGILEGAFFHVAAQLEIKQTSRLDIKNDKVIRP